MMHLYGDIASIGDGIRAIVGGTTVFEDIVDHKITVTIVVLNVDKLCLATTERAKIETVATTTSRGRLDLCKDLIQEQLSGID